MLVVVLLTILAGNIFQMQQMFNWKIKTPVGGCIFFI